MKRFVKSLKKSRKTASICVLLERLQVISSIMVISCVSHECFSAESIWASIKTEFLSKSCIMVENNICSITFQQINVMDTGRLFSAEHLSSFYKLEQYRIYAGHQESDQCPMTFEKQMLKQELLQQTVHVNGLLAYIRTCSSMLIQFHRRFSTPDVSMVI